MSDWTSALHRDIRSLARDLLAFGWEYAGTSNKNHPRLRWPASGETVALPSSPSDFRSLPNTRAEARRISGFGAVKHHGPRFRAVRGSGFDLDVARRESFAHRRQVEEALALLASIDEQIVRCNPLREQARCRVLAARRIEAAARVEALGADVPAPQKRDERRPMPGAALGSTRPTQ